MNDAPSHTPEPWIASVGGYQILTGDEWETVCVFHSRNSKGEFVDHRMAAHEDGRGAADPSANAQRIVACVNACAGLNPEAIPELVASLPLLMALYRLKWGNLDEDANSAFEKTMAALGKIKPRTPQ